MEPSIPVMNDGPISAGKVVAVGPFGTGADGPDVPGASNDMAAIASWSSNVKDTNRRAISLHGNLVSYPRITNRVPTSYTSRPVHSGTPIL
jgi:hypothetical protein